MRTRHPWAGAYTRPEAGGLACQATRPGKPAVSPNPCGSLTSSSSHRIAGAGSATETVIERASAEGANYAGGGAVCLVLFVSLLFAHGLFPL